MLAVSLWLVVSTFVAIPLLIQHERHTMEVALRRGMAEEYSNSIPIILTPLPDVGPLVHPGVVVHELDAYDFTSQQDVEKSVANKGQVAEVNQDSLLAQSQETRFMPSSQFWNRLAVMFGVSMCVVLGGLLGVRALTRWRAWEFERQEGNLAYDLAYTTSVNEVGYGTYWPPAGVQERYYDV